MKQYLNKEFLLSNKKLVMKTAAIGFLIVVAFFVFVLHHGEKKQDVPVVQTTAAASATGGEGGSEAAETIFVDVGGAVETPKVVELKAGSRVQDAIALAGGLKATADITNLNRAAFLEDGEKLYIPAIGEVVADTGSPVSSQGGSAVSSKVNLNTATSEELQTLNGVGPSIAGKIIDYRKSNGYFKTIEELKNVKGIGDKTFEKLKEHIRV